MIVFNVLFSIRKGLGPDYFNKTISIGFDDVTDDMPVYRLREQAVYDAERVLYNSEDFRWYGKNWFIVEVTQN